LLINAIFSVIAFRRSGNANSAQRDSFRSTPEIPVEGRISISYRFGNMTESIRKVQRSITNDDVLDGGSGSGIIGGGSGGM